MNWLGRILILCAISAVSAGYLSSQYQIYKYEAKISEMTLTYEENLRKETERVLEKERTISDISSEIEANNNAKQQKINELEARVSKLVSDGSFRLRDPGSTRKACSSNSSKPAPVNNDKAGSELSEEFTRFLWSEASRADRVTEQLTFCQTYIQKLAETVNPE